MDSKGSKGRKKGGELSDRLKTAATQPEESAIPQLVSDREEVVTSGLEAESGEEEGPPTLLFLGEEPLAEAHTGDVHTGDVANVEEVYTSPPPPKPAKKRGPTEPSPSSILTPMTKQGLRGARTARMDSPTSPSVLQPQNVDDVETVEQSVHTAEVAVQVHTPEASQKLSVVQTSPEPVPKSIPDAIPAGLKRTGVSVKREGIKGFAPGTKEALLCMVEWLRLRGFSQPEQEVAEATGVDIRTIRIYAKLTDHTPDCQYAHIPKTNPTDVCICTLANDTPRFGKWKRKKEGPNRQSWRATLDDMHFWLIRKSVHDFFKEGESPTVEMVLERVKERLEDEFPYDGTVLRQILRKKLGIVYIVRKNIRQLFDRGDIITMRMRYITKIRQHRLEGRYVVYLDETWLNANMIERKGWFDKQIFKDRELFKQTQGPRPELTRNLPTPPGRGKRAIVVSAVMETGFVPNATYIFKSSKTKHNQPEDYHAEMNADTFEWWFKKRLHPNIPPNSVIVMDNAPYHVRKTNKAPTKNSTLADMRKWMSDNNIPYESTCTRKAPYLAIINERKAELEGVSVVEWAEAQGHTILRLPPYHCEINPIEPAWSQFKRLVKKEIKCTWNKIDAVIKYGYDAIDKLNENPAYFQNLFRHVVTKEDELSELDGGYIADLQAGEIDVPLMVPNDDDDDDDEDEEGEEGGQEGAVGDAQLDAFERGVGGEDFDSEDEVEY